MALLPYQPKKIRFAELLLAIKAQVVARAVVAPSMVLIVASDDKPTTKAEKLVYLRPRRFMVEQDQNESAGRLDSRIVRQLDVYLSNRVSLDPINSDEVWLTSAGRSYFDLEEDVLGALHDWTPTDADQNSLTLQDIRILSGAQPDKEAVGLGWGRANGTFELVYHPPLSLVDILPAALAPTTPAGWLLNTTYARGTFVGNGGFSYCVKVAHTSTATDEPGVGINSDTYWALATITVGDSVNLEFTQTGMVTAAQAWLTATAYAVNVVVTDSNKSFCCILAHTAGAITEPGVGASWQTYWTQLPPFAWVTATSYGFGTLVSDSGKTFRCTLPHKSLVTNRPGSGADWHTVWSQVLPRLAWTSGTGYYKKDSVTHAGQLFTCGQDHTAGALTEPGVGTNWRKNWVLAPAVANIGLVWAIVTDYITGDLVTANGQLYVCTTAHTSVAGVNQPGFGDWRTYWKITPVWTLAPLWEAGRAYPANANAHISSAAGGTYVAIVGHTSAAADEPGLGVHWATYWAPSTMLPAGLALNPNTGAITGAPSHAGNGATTTCMLLLTVTDAATGLSGWRRYLLPVAIQIVGTLPAGTRNVPYSQTLAAMGATGAVSWGIQLNSGTFGEALPPGLVLNAVTGIVSGLPRAVDGETYPRTYRLTVQVVDSAGNSGTQMFSLVIT